MTPTFQGEVLMRRWSDSSTQGVQVTFALSDASDLEPLKIKTGKRFMAVLVEIGDDEQPVEVRNRTSEAPKGGEWAKLAGMWCRDEDFWRFWGDRFGEEIKDTGRASASMRYQCGIESRAELDHDPEALKRFNEEIRYPFMEWMKARGIRK